MPGFFTCPSRRMVRLLMTTFIKTLDSRQTKSGLIGVGGSLRHFHSLAKVHSYTVRNNFCVAYNFSQAEFRAFFRSTKTHSITTNVFVVVVALWSEPNRKISLKVTTHIAHFVRLNAHRFHFFGHQFLFRAIDFACGSRMQDHDQLALPIVVVRCGVLRVFLGHANLWCDDDVDWWLYNGPFQVDFYNMLHCVSVTTGAGGCAGMNPSQLRVCCESIGQVGWPCITYAYILYTIRKGWIRRRSRTKLEIPHSV